jgi:hypothetical protein
MEQLEVGGWPGHTEAHAFLAGLSLHLADPGIPPGVDVLMALVCFEHYDQWL